MQRVLLTTVAATLLTACGGTGAHAVRQENTGAASTARTDTKTATLALSSAIVAPTPWTMTLSCHGGAFCRENIIASGHDDVVEDVTSDCARRGGTLNSSNCAREATAASCSVAGGEGGPITVFTYAQASAGDQAKAIATMKEICSEFEGVFELLTKQQATQPTDSTKSKSAAQVGN